MAHPNITEDMQRCLVLCRECHDICLSTVSHCLAKGGRHANADHIGLLLDCAEICQTSANFLTRGSRLHPVTCGACAEICQRCAEQCARIADDGVMRRCAEVCSSCAEQCLRMAAVPVG